MITIIVPVFKAEKYLLRCIDSIFAQSFTDFELLLIDDGSPDNCGTICDEYAARDSRVRVFHKDNGGVSSARNLGIAHATGKWITFIDADDYVHPEFLSSLYSMHDADLIVGSFQLVGTDEKWDGLLEDCFYDKVSFEKKIADFSLSLNFHTPWGKLFRREIIVDNNLVFNEKISAGEDALFILNYLIYTNTLRLSKDAYYFYERGNNGSLSQSICSIEHHFYAMDKYYEALIELENTFKCSMQHLYIICVRGYCSKIIDSIYNKNNDFINKWNQLRLLYRNKHIIFLLKKEKPTRKRVKLFNLLMSHKMGLLSLLYIYILRGEIY